MISNKFKRNFWLTLTILGVFVVVSRIIGVTTGEDKWWELLSSICVSLVMLRLYLSYRKAVKEGNLFGHVNPFGRQ